MAVCPKNAGQRADSILCVARKLTRGHDMSKLTEEAVQALSELSEIEQKCCLSLVGRFEHLGIAHHASSAVCSLAGCDVLPIKK